MSRLISTTLTLLALAALTTGVQAQNKTADNKGTAKTVDPPKVTAIASDKTVDTSGPLLGPDDIIEISVSYHPDYDKVLTVLPDGTIEYREMGAIKVAGMTPRDLATRIQTELDKHLNNAVVSVSLRETHSKRVRILGPVERPGAFDLKPNRHLLDVIAEAGGLAGKPAHISGQIIRDNVKQIPLNLTQAFAKPDSDANPLIQPDDLILLNEIEVQKRFVNIMGQVQRPGNFEIQDDTTLLQMLAQAGYPTQVAALTKSYVIRDHQQIPLNLRPLFDGQPGEGASQFKLENNDILFIPAVDTQYQVQGAVGRPGSYLMPEKGEVRVQDAINQAGGLAPNADASKAKILKVVDGKVTEEKPVNIDALNKKHDLANNLVLHPNDVLFVPPRGKRGPTLGDFFAPLSILNLLGFHFL